MRSPIPGRLTAASLLLGILGPGPTHAQVVRDFQASRPLAGESRLAARVELHEGVYRLGAAAPGRLYEFDLAFDPERWDPLSGLGVAGLELGVRGEPARGVRLQPQARLVQNGSIGLSSEVEWALDLLLAGVEADLDFGAVPLTALTVDAGASRTALHFPALNPALCRQATFRVGAGELTLDRFGNSGCRSVTLTGRFGRVILDLAGALPGDVTADLGLTAGSLVLRLPRGVGVRVRSSEVLALFDNEGLIRQGEYWMTQGYREARRKLDLRLTSSFAKVTVEWEAP